MPRQIALVMWFALLALLAPWHEAQAAEIVRAFKVEVAAGAAGDDTLEHGVYLFRLHCGPNLSFCSFQRVTLNQCAAGGAGERTFFPSVDSWVTSSDQLKVRRSGSHEIELTVYQASGRTLPARVVLTFAAGRSEPFEELTGFRTTGFIDLRHWPRLDTRIEYVPVPNDRGKILDCPLSLRGLKR